MYANAGTWSQMDPSVRKPKGCYGTMVLQIKTPARSYMLWPKYDDDLISWQAAVNIPPVSPSSHSQPTVGIMLLAESCVRVCLYPLMLASDGIEGLRCLTMCRNQASLHPNTQQLIEDTMGHLYSTPMKLERLLQCGR